MSQFSTDDAEDLKAFIWALEEVARKRWEHNWKVRAEGHYRAKYGATKSKRLKALYAELIDYLQTHA